MSNPRLYAISPSLSKIPLVCRCRLLSRHDDQFIPSRHTSLLTCHPENVYVVYTITSFFILQRHPAVHPHCHTGTLAHCQVPDPDSCDSPPQQWQQNTKIKHTATPSSSSKLYQSCEHFPFHAFTGGDTISPFKFVMDLDLSRGRRWSDANRNIRRVRIESERYAHYNVIKAMLNTFSRSFIYPFRFFSRC